MPIYFGEISRAIRWQPIFQNSTVDGAIYSAKGFALNVAASYESLPCHWDSASTGPFSQPTGKIRQEQIKVKADFLKKTEKWADWWLPSQTMVVTLCTWKVFIPIKWEISHSGNQTLGWINFRLGRLLVTQAARHVQGRAETRHWFFSRCQRTHKILRLKWPYENLASIYSPYGRNKIDVKVPAVQIAAREYWDQMMLISFIVVGCSSPAWEWLSTAHAGWNAKHYNNARLAGKALQLWSHNSGYPACNLLIQSCSAMCLNSSQKSRRRKTICALHGLLKRMQSRRHRPDAEQLNRCCNLSVSQAILDWIILLDELHNDSRPFQIL